MYRHAVLTHILDMRWKPSADLLAVAASWVAVVGALYTASVIVGPDTGGGLPYFALYAVLAATVFGMGIPLYWTVVVRRRSVAELGLTLRKWKTSVVLQLLLAVPLYASTLARQELPAPSHLLPLVALALSIGLFEAVFWRGWVLQRLGEAFGVVPAVLVGALLYAAYHVGYAMPVGEMVFLFFVGVLFATVFLLTRSVLILWPVFQPMGQLTALLRDGLTLPPLAALGFAEALIVMLVLIWLAERRFRRQQATAARPAT
jgi:membrane protease YdiL (CAAX protease family)